MKTKQMFVGLGVVAALGAAVVPMASYAVTDNDSSTVNVSLRVGSTISMSLDGDTINPAILTSEDSQDQTTVATISTNSATGYTLSAETSSADGSLVGTDENNTIGYVGASYADVTEGWALSVGDDLKDIAGKKISLFSSDSTADSEEITVGYNFKTDADTVPDTYSTTLTYTASVK